MTGSRHVLVAHPSADAYGSDRQLAESMIAFREAGWDVSLCLPADGPLTGIVDAKVRFVGFPVLRKALLRPHRLMLLVLGMPTAVLRLVRLIRELRPDLVYVNTVTIPWWIFAARLCRVRVFAHVHEAEDAAPRAVRIALNAPLLLADTVIANSFASRQVLVAAVPALARRTRVVPNGIPDNGAAPFSSARRGHLALVGRLSPRKGVDVALEAVALLRNAGRDVTLEICGTVFPGYEWFEKQLRDRARQPDLAGSVTFAGYVNPTLPVLARSEVVLVPSRTEPFGNTAVEALLAARPLVASDVQGLAEIVEHQRTGLLVPPDDATALAGAVARYLDDPDWARRVAAVGRSDALRRFGVERYRTDIRQLITSACPALSTATSSMCAPWRSEETLPRRRSTMLASRGSTIAHLAVRNGRRLRGRLRLIGIRPDGVASSAVVRAIAAAATGRPCRDERYWLRRIELMRSLLLTSPVPLELVDLGAGAGARLEGRDASGGRVVKKTLGEMTLSSKPQRWAYLLFRIVRELQPEAVLEMGSCVGISAAYQAAALELNGSGRLVTLEGAEQLAETTKRTLNDLNLERRAEVRLGHFSETLDAALTDLKPIGLAFIDGNHVEDATVEYMQLISSVAADEAVLVFDDINWSDGMRRAWSRILADDRFALTVDLQSVGIAVLSRSSSKRITARIPYY